MSQGAAASFRAIVRLTALALLAGCASLGGTPALRPTTSPSALATPGSTGGTATARITIVVPRAIVNAARSRKYVSPATQSLTVSVDGATPTIVNLTVNSPNCSVAAPLNDLSCTIAIVVAPGSHDFNLIAYDGLGGTGNALSANDVTASIVQDTANAISFTLAGVPVAVQAVPQPGSVVLFGTETAGFSIVRDTTQSFNVTTLDAAGHYIVGPGSPMLVASITGLTNGAAISVNAATNGDTNQFALSSTGFGSGTLVITATPASSAAGSPLTVSIPIASTTLASTFSGVVGAFESVDGSATTAQFRAPNGTAYDPANGNLYIVQQGGNFDTDGEDCEVRQISPSGAVTTLAGNATCTITDGTGTAAAFLFPNGIAYDPITNDLYVTDSSGCAIRQVTLAGVVTTIAGGFDLGGTEQTLGCGNADGPGALSQFQNPIGIAYNPSDQNLYVTDSGNCTVRQIVPTGSYTVKTIAGSAPSVTNVGVCPTYTDGTGTTAAFNYPESLAVNPTNGNLEVTDDGNCLIRQVTLAGVVTTIAGLPPTTAKPAPTNCGYADGVGSKAQFSTSLGVAYDTKDGTLYVADALNCSIRQVTLSGAVSTVSGPDPAACSVVNGLGAQAHFDEPTFPVYVASSDSLFLTDYVSDVIRQVQL